MDGEERTLTFHLLGPLRVWHDGAELAVGRPGHRAVLAALVLRVDEVVARDELIDGLWGDRPPPSAVSVVHTYVAKLRQILEPGRTRREPGQVLVSTAGGYRLRVPCDRCDTCRFDQFIGSARVLRAAGDLVPAEERFRLARRLWRGQALTGIPGPLAGVERTRLEEERMVVAEEHLEVLLALGAHREAIAELSGLVARYPLREGLRGLLMLALYRAGRQGEALAAFHDGRQQLAEELGVDPGPELRRLMERILTADPWLDGRSPADAAPGAPPDHRRRPRHRQPVGVTPPPRIRRRWRK